MSRGICKRCGGSFYESHPGARGEDLCDTCDDRDRQFMVRIIRDSDDEHADIVVTTNSEEKAKALALSLARANPSLYFGDENAPQYYVDPSSDVEDVTGGEYASANEVKP
ncbi:MAG: hypothetical protein PGN22_02780 [Agrobacterium cavarae]